MSKTHVEKLRASCEEPAGRRHTVALSDAELLALINWHRGHVKRLNRFRERASLQIEREVEWKPVRALIIEQQDAHMTRNKELLKVYYP